MQTVTYPVDIYSQNETRNSWTAAPGFEPCSNCKGHGSFIRQSNAFSIGGVINCPTCKGSGRQEVKP